jgi:glycosyltransferase involved in cell wall biosynthesis
MSAVTVAICTHNRARIVSRAVASALEHARSVGGDVLVVDNASTDNTPAVLATLAREAPGVLRTMREPQLGLSAARNRALAETAAPIVVFLDDDAEPHPGWLAALLATHADERVVCAGGPIRLRFTTPTPAWLLPELHSTLTAYDLGPTPRPLHQCPGWDYPYGANVSFRTDAARAAGGFSPRFGHRGRRQMQHEETDLCMRLDAAGGEIRYVPEAAVDHWVLAERLTPAFFLARHWQRGQSGAICEVLNRGWRPALKRFRWWDGPHLLVAPYRPRDPVDAQRLLAECRRREALGFVLGLARALVLAPGARRIGMRPVARAERIGIATP